MKTVDEIKELIGACKVKKLTFRHAGAGVKIKRKGFAFYHSSIAPNCNNIYEVLTLEPCEYSNGDKWIVYGSLVNRYKSGLFYAKNIRDAKKKIKKMFN